MLRLSLILAVIVGVVPISGIAFGQEHTVVVEPDKFRMNPGEDNKKDPAKLKVRNNGPSSSVIRAEVRHPIAASWFETITAPINLAPGKTDSKPPSIFVKVPEDFALARAGKYDVEIHVTDDANKGYAGKATVHLTINRVGDYDVKASEGTPTTRNSAKYELSVTNNANAPLKMILKPPAKDTPWEFVGQEIQVDPKANKPLAFTVLPKDKQNPPVGTKIPLVLEGS